MLSMTEIQTKVKEKILCDELNHNTRQYLIDENRISKIYLEWVCTKGLEENKRRVYMEREIQKDRYRKILTEK